MEFLLHCPALIFNATPLKCTAAQLIKNPETFTVFHSFVSMLWCLLSLPPPVKDSCGGGNKGLKGCNVADRQLVTGCTQGANTYHTDSYLVDCNNVNRVELN